ncbi:MAG: hypothetical protein E5X67_08740 [Mesorhizobium sp.]|uniref:hypothetical protein n=1 Tax=Mesorhizobium sp. TaxID=1871066 RepID=UPI000FE86914|nr:hypothetical protein [Mesorhizobium sp.]RWP15983.1 MAG: hypothetical protein EOR01_28400 [Mesorhizobium sp.]TIP29045.1 MAG: hypothetical protein E5X67_08740 [Mesorhizobium sp.]
MIRMNFLASAPSELLQALDALGQAPATDINHLQRAPAFLRVLELCQGHYSGIGSGSTLRFAIASALQQLGLACLVDRTAPGLAVPTIDVLNGLDLAIRSTSTTRRHLCPLDLADELPPVSFGRNQVRRFSPAELGALVDFVRLKRAHRTWVFDSARFAQFTWLVVEEDVEHPSGVPGVRTLPGLLVNLGQDLGRIEPHRSGLPASVEAALFGLLTIPWEDIADYREMDWRVFRIPWVYTIDGDVFARPRPPPSPDSLSWEPAWRPTGYEDEEEYERPVNLPLEDNSSAIDWLNDRAWAELTSARNTSLFERPVAHFFVRGFQSEGIDEFLAHISTIEAALGSPVDHDAKKRPRVGGPKQGATHRVCLRISGLLDDATVGTTYAKLFGLRSDFLHGKPMGDIPGSERRTAREIARKVVCALIGAAVSVPSVDRDQFLADLLDGGARLDQKMNSMSQSEWRHWWSLVCSLPADKAYKPFRRSSRSSRTGGTTIPL